VFTPFADLGGGGARRFADGVNTCDASSNPKLSKANIETIERTGPMLYLFRRQAEDSGGPGTFRGGVGSELAWTTHKAPTGRVNGVLYVSGLEPAMSHGLFGGLPGCNTLCELQTGTGVRAALREGTPTDDVAALGGEVRSLPPQGLVEVDQDAVFHARADGGGGVGDPLLRAPEAVLADVEAGLVTAAQARGIYGVVLDGAGTAVDTGATAARRAELRAARRADGASGDRRRDGTASAPVAQPVRYDLAGGAVSCASCGQRLGSVRDNWKLAAARREEPLAALGALWRSRRFVVRSFSCPGCGALLDTEMTLPEDAPVWEYRI
jgi:N-methylhydantoinase B